MLKKGLTKLSLLQDAFYPIFVLENEGAAHISLVLLKLFLLNHKKEEDKKSKKTGGKRGKKKAHLKTFTNKRDM